MAIPDNLRDFVERVRVHGRPPFTGSLLCLDPGETTGWAQFVRLNLVNCGQFPTTTGTDLELVFRETHPDTVVVENYRVYAHRAKQHIGSEVPTIQFLGVIKYLAEMRGIPIVLQSAFQAKGFATDARLRQLGLYQEHKRHANDAVRHGVYYLVFG